MPSIGLQISWRIQIKTGYNGSLQRLAKETSLSLIQGESSTARERFSALPAFFGPSRALYFGCVNPPTVHQKGRLHLEFAELFHYPSDCRQDDHMWARKPGPLSPRPRYWPGRGQAGASLGTRHGGPAALSGGPFVGGYARFAARVRWRSGIRGALGR